MKIAYVPIDERPCNVEMVKRIASSSKDIELLLPEGAWLSKKKEPADTESLWDWIISKASETDAIIVSIDMLVYGGLLPSRLHDMSFEQGLESIERLKQLRASYPHIPVYASNVIMRAPNYNSCDEEPDYYEEWGRDLFLRSYFRDKQKRTGLSNSENSHLREIESRLPTKWIEDYEMRREYNLRINKEILKLVQKGILTFLSIPQDDSSEYGYTAIDHARVMYTRYSMNLYDSVQIYPGADEVGATLLSRAYNEFQGSCPKIYPFWSSTLGPQLIPLYEDRPFGESLKAHILAAGCQLTDSPDKADLLLAYNTPGNVMQESWEQESKDISYSSFRNLQFFTEQIHSSITNGGNVIIADSAFANGGDLELIKQLDTRKVLDKIISYKGWNTNCNTLGSTISQGVIGLNGEPEIIQENICYHLLDDYFYQAEIRMRVTNELLPPYELTYFNLKDKADTVNEERNKQLWDRYHAVIYNSFKDKELRRIQTYAPWNRMFECAFILEFER